MSLNSPPYTEEAASGEDLERRKSASKVTLPLRAAGAEPEGTSVKNLSEDQDPILEVSQGRYTCCSGACAFTPFQQRCDLKSIFEKSCWS
jgi:hypothetical protein